MDRQVGVVTPTLRQLYQRLLSSYGPQDWWPADDAFEMMVGAILTQNTNWTNVERAIANLKATAMLDCDAIAAAALEQLAGLIRPSGFFNQKSQRLQGFAQFYIAHGKAEGLKRIETEELRRMLLAIPGIGPETADSMLLYALDKPIFVVDAYTRRIFSRLGLLPEKSSYDDVQVFFERQLEHDLYLFQEYHALIVAHAKRHCRPKPLCERCPLKSDCAAATAL